MASLMINELLCFVSVQNNKLNRENLQTSLHDFYSLEEAVELKQILVIECEEVNLSDSISDFKIRRQESKAGAKPQVIEDILEIWGTVDREKGGKLQVQFVAGNPNKLPSVNAEKFNLQFLIGSISKLQEQVSTQQTTLGDVTKTLTAINLRLDTPPILAIPATATTTFDVTPSRPLPTSNVRTATSQTTSTANPILAVCTPTSAHIFRKRRLTVSANTFTPGSIQGSAKRKQIPQATSAVSLVSTDTGSSFADQAKRLHDNEKPWNIVEARKKKKLVVTVGTSDTALLTGVEAPKREKRNFGKSLFLVSVRIQPSSK
jgi:hypothetical protein